MEEKAGNESRPISRYTGETKERLLASYRKSGLSQKQWCERSGVKLSTLTYWLKRDREQAKGYSLVAVETTPREARVRINGVELAVEGKDGIAVLAALVRELGS
jgi:transposase-like protein